MLATIKNKINKINQMLEGNDTEIPNVTIVIGIDEPNKYYLEYPSTNQKIEVKEQVADKYIKANNDYPIEVIITDD